MSYNSDPRVYVYIAGPYTHGDVAQNVREAIAAANAIARLGVFPYVPHLSHFWHMLYPQPYTFWMSLDQAWLSRCDILYRLPGYSEGADVEIQYAVSLGIPVVDANLAQLRSEIDRVQKRKAQEAQDVV